MTVATAQRWWRDAACLDYPQGWWFPDRRPRSGEAARDICERCLVRAECLTFALSRNEDHGIWGGFAVREIDVMKRARCQRCRERMPATEAAVLAIRGTDRGLWMCRACWYRGIQERKRA